MSKHIDIQQAHLNPIRDARSLLWRSLLATNSVGPLMTTCLELCLKLAQSTSMNWRGLEECSTLSSLSLEIVAGAGRNDAGKANQIGEEGGSVDHVVSTPIIKI